VHVRQATTDEADGLFEVQRAASLAGLAHIYPPDLYPYPDDAVRERWRTFTGSILVAEHGTKIVGVAGIADDWLQGFYVLPEAWGTDVAHALHAAAIDVGVSRLWCLEHNHRARRFYEKRGWTANGETRVVEYPPHPLDLGYSRSA
jgi:GNAT superfamily N-acetyltransferase